MRTQRDVLRLTGLLATAGLLLGPVVAPRASAQGAPPPPPAGAAAPADQSTADPPARVGRLALVTGTVSFHTTVDTDWSPASLNYPVVAGNSFWTEPGAETDLELGGSRIALNESTELDLATLDNTGATATVPQGEVYVHVRVLAQGETIALQTPRGVVTIAAPGDYDVVAGDTVNPTVVTVVTGSAQVSDSGAGLSVGAGQAATFTGTNAFQGGVGAAAPDAFLTAMLARNQPPPTPAAGAVAAPVFVGAMTGGQDLAAVGTWQSAPEYGQVWYPPVAAGWAPYRDGHWAYVQPWGWTWVDQATWGFAPFHYGRWARFGDRWGWVPGVQVGVAVAPVYAPALVTFFGVGAGVGVTVGGSVGWCPLAPGEVFHPWYHASDVYVRNVNPHITNITNVTNVTINSYHNASFVTVVPAETLTTSRPVARAVVRVTPQQLAVARPTTGREPIRPTAATAGVTPAVARQLRIAPAPGVAPRRAAPGPAVHPVAAVVPGHPAAVPLRAPMKPVVVRPGEVAPGTRPAVPGAPGAVGTPPRAPGVPAKPETPATRPAEVPRPGTTPPTAHPEPAVAKPGVEPRPAETPHPADVPHPGTPPVTRPTPAVAKPAEAPHPAEAPRPAEAPHPGTPPVAHPTPAVAKPAEAPRPAETPHPAEVPHSATPPAAHPTPVVEKPAETPHPAEPTHPTTPAASHPAATPPVAHPDAKKPVEEKKPEEKKTE